MDLLTLVGLSVGLAMDAFAVSVARGGAARCVCARYSLRMAAYFGGFQFLMPILGWVLGASFRGPLHDYDHWVAFGLLTAIGGKMLWESRELKTVARCYSCRNEWELFILAIATSMDALAVGVSLSLLYPHSGMLTGIFYPALVIGAVTFAISWTGVHIGIRFGHWFERGIEALGGVVLIGIGIQILYSHTA